MNLLVVANLAAFVLALAWLAHRKKRGASLSANVLVGLLLGVVLGAALQWGTGTATRR